MKSASTTSGEVLIYVWVLSSVARDRSSISSSTRDVGSFSLLMRKLFRVVEDWMDFLFRRGIGRPDPRYITLDSQGGSGVVGFDEAAEEVSGAQASVGDGTEEDSLRREARSTPNTANIVSIASKSETEWAITAKGGEKRFRVWCEREERICCQK